MPGLLAFHAHPDDESLAMGGTLARYAAAGEQVVVVTATRGEVGEIHNHEDRESLRPRLGEIRTDELREACRILGVSRVEILGYRDSGMMGTPDNRHPDAFWGADFMEAVGRLVRHIRACRPEVMTAYDPYGGYGHPDHIQVHRVGTAAFFGAADVGRFPPQDGEEPWQPAKLYWSTWPRARTREVRRLMAETGQIPAEEAAREPDHGTRDEDITTWLDVRPWFDQKWEAVLAHHTQIAEDSWFRTLPEDLRREGFGRETFVRVFSRVDDDPEAPDLFDGLR
ncbi:MAG TPA: PIG-L family deacetylase [Gemmatimonadales bacterium]|nr:PIG-L family deacetylase [Gemmatimonadales bacterium]